MAAILKGTVFNDLNNNTQFDPDEPGIEGVIVVLYDGTSCIQTTTDGDGVYSFDIDTPGEYVVYETVEDPGSTCPPTFCGQPEGFTVSNTKRKTTVTVTQTDIDTNTELEGGDYGHANQPFIPCLSVGFQIADGVLYFINMVTGEALRQGDTGVSGNALAYESNSEKLFYLHNGDLVRINGDLSLTRLAKFGFTNAATCDERGRMYVPRGGTRYEWIQVNQESPEFLETGELITNQDIRRFFDLTYNPVDRKIHTGMQNVDIDTGETVNVTYTPPIPPGAKGAAFSDMDGFDYWIINGSGQILRVEATSETTGDTIDFSKTVSTSLNDGAACIFASLNPDFGDAPDTGELPLGPNNYRTLFEKDGPRHARVDGLFIGGGLTQEGNALQNADATGDEDDGVTLPLSKLRPNVSEYTLDVQVTNSIGESANLYGWIDFNKDGIFTEAESADVIIVESSDTNPRSFTLRFTLPQGVDITEGFTFVRVRLTTDNLTNSNGIDEEDTRSYGVANDGEVEDYQLEIGAEPRASITKIVDKDVAELGEEITYTFVVKNEGDIGIINTTIVDTLPINSVLIEPPRNTRVSENSNGETVLNINVHNLNIGRTYTVTFKIRGISLEPTDLLLNDGVLNFKSEDTGDTTNYQAISNIVETRLLPLKPVTIRKIVDKRYADLGEEIMYTLVMENPNLIPAIDNIFKDTIPEGTDYVNNSFTDDGEVKSGNPEIGIPVSDIPGGGVKTVTFKVKVKESFN